MKTSNTNEGGFIMKIILLVGAIFALKYFLDFDLFEWFKSEKVQTAIAPVWSFLKSIYYWLDEFVRELVN